MKRYSYSAFANRVMRENRYIHDDETRGFLDFIASSFPERHLTLPKGSQLWRSQLGYNTETEIVDGEEYGEIPAPWGPTRMIPDASNAGENRASPRGIAYLYLATSKETAMHEVRPWAGSDLSTALFRICSDQNLVDFSNLHGIEQPPVTIASLHQAPNKEEVEKSVWIDIDNAFSQPVPNNEDPRQYIPTQIIAELVKHKGYDGIAYKSVFSGGFNVALFNVKAASLVFCEQFSVGKVSIDFKKEEYPS